MLLRQFYLTEHAEEFTCGFFIRLSDGVKLVVRSSKRDVNSRWEHEEKGRRSSLRLENRGSRCVRSRRGAPNLNPITNQLVAVPSYDVYVEVRLSRKFIFDHSRPVSMIWAERFQKPSAQCREFRVRENDSFLVLVASYWWFISTLVILDRNRVEEKTKTETCLDRTSSKVTYCTTRCIVQLRENRCACSTYKLRLDDKCRRYSYLCWGVCVYGWNRVCLWVLLLSLVSDLT